MATESVSATTQNEIDDFRVSEIKRLYDEGDDSLKAIVILAIRHFATSCDDNLGEDPLLKLSPEQSLAHWRQEVDNFGGPARVLSSMGVK